MDAIKHLLQREEVLLVTLTGPGGVGKTRLGLQVAAELTDCFTDGVFFVNLAPLTDFTLVVPTIAQTLGIREMPGQQPLDRLKEQLQQRQLLLLLDNFEQVGTAATQVAELLAACQRLKLVVTSREKLHIQAEHEYEVPSLAFPDLTHLPDLAALLHFDAVALFLERAQATKSDFQLTAANAHAIADICGHLDGLPLAIELAAARVKLLSPQALLARLSQRLTVLTSGARDAPERQQTLRNTIEWSYQLLNASEQKLFCSLAVFSGGCSLEAVEAVCGAICEATGNAFSALDGVASLIDKSLLRNVEQEGKGDRLVMLETIREYALEMLKQSTEAEIVQRAHAAYYLALAEEAEPGMIGAGKAKWLEWLQQEHENLRAAIAWLLQHKEQEAALRLCGALWRFWWMRGYVSEGRAELTWALAGSQEMVAMPVRAKALHVAGELANRQGDFEQVETLCGESLSLFRALDDPRGSASSLTILGYTAAWQRSDFVTARARLEEAVSLYREANDRYDITLALVFLALVYILQGDYDWARTLAEEAAALDREEGDSWRITNSLWLLGLVISYQGDLTRAQALLEESLALARLAGYKEAVGNALFVSGQVSLQQGDFALARAQFEESLALSRELGEQPNVAQSLSGLAMVSFVKGDYAEARTLLEESLTLSRSVGNTWFIAACLVCLGAVVAAQGEAVWAVRLLSVAWTLCEGIHGVLPPAVRAIQEFTSAAARAQLGVEVFAVAWDEGRTMTPDQALAAKGPVTRPASKVPAYPAGLTKREVQVLRLVAKGLTDAQIAESLIISPGTVNTHLKSIYGKIGVSSRSAATRWAIDHGLI